MLVISYHESEMASKTVTLVCLTENGAILQFSAVLSVRGKTLVKWCRTRANDVKGLRQPCVCVCVCDLLVILNTVCKGMY